MGKQYVYNINNVRTFIPQIHTKVTACDFFSLKFSIYAVVVSYTIQNKSSHKAVFYIDASSTVMSRNTWYLTVLLF